MGRQFTAMTFLLGCGIALIADAASLAKDAADPADTRKSLIARSKVWFPTDIPSMNLRTGPAGPESFAPGATVTCEYLDRKLSGASPKFACRLPDGDELKVKYGGANGEVYGEVAASRLLWALGFGADRSAGEDGRCSVPMMIINDLGVTFGRSNAFNQQPAASVNLAKWANVPVWKDSGTCVGNLSGSFTGTLKNPVISEQGRRFLADLLTQLSDQQLRDMFEAARVQLRPRAPESGRSGFPTVEEWVNAFKQKRAEIQERRCAA